MLVQLIKVMQRYCNTVMAVAQIIADVDATRIRQIDNPAW